MSEYNKNPLHVLGEFSWADYSIFKAHLRLPRPYLRIIFRNYKDLRVTMTDLPRIITGYSEHVWEKRKMTVAFKEKLYQAGGIPPMFHRTSVYCTNNSKDQGDIAATVRNADKLGTAGVNLYFYSDFQESAMHAACDILRSAIDKKLAGFCANYPVVLDAIKTWDKDNSMLNRVLTADLLVLWGVGCEYVTEYTTTQLQGILTGRKANLKATIVVSSLTPKDYKSRYGVEPEGATVGFKDVKLRQTLSEVSAMLEGNTANG